MRFPPPTGLPLVPSRTSAESPYKPTWNDYTLRFGGRCTQGVQERGPHDVRAARWSSRLGRGYPPFAPSLRAPSLVNPSTTRSSIATSWAAQHRGDCVRVLGGYCPSRAPPSLPRGRLPLCRCWWIHWCSGRLDPLRPHLGPEWCNPMAVRPPPGPGKLAEIEGNFYSWCERTKTEVWESARESRSLSLFDVAELSADSHFPDRALSTPNTASSAKSRSLRPLNFPIAPWLSRPAPCDETGRGARRY